MAMLMSWARGCLLLVEVHSRWTRHGDIIPTSIATVCPKDLPKSHSSIGTLIACPAKEGFRIVFVTLWGSGHFDNVQRNPRGLEPWSFSVEGHFCAGDVTRPVEFIKGGRLLGRGEWWIRSMWRGAIGR